MSRIVLEIHIIVKNEVKMPRFLLFKLFGIVFLNFIIFKRLRQLIGAACAVSALNAFKQSYIISSILCPTTRRDMPCVFPLQPLTNLTDFKTSFSSTLKMISLEQVPFVL